jgi:hypothetical protein
VILDTKLGGSQEVSACRYHEKRDRKNLHKVEWKVLHGNDQTGRFLSL